MSSAVAERVWVAHARRAVRVTAAASLLPAVLCLCSCEDGGSGSRAGEVVYSVDTSDKVVALTFDDGPNPPYTLAVLDELKAAGAKATFFLLGYSVDANPAVAARIAAEGHEIGNHSYSHPWYGQISAEDIEHELQACDDAVLRATGKLPTLLRPPFGDAPDVLTGIARRRGYPIIQWSGEGYDIQLSSGPAIAAELLKNLRPGLILLLHDGRRTWLGTDRSATVVATRIALAELARQGYRTVTVSELLKK